MKPKILSIDPWLRPYEADIALRMDNYREKLSSLLAPGQTLGSFANGHLFYGFHKTGEGWIYREWAPAAEQLFLIGDFNGWNETSHPMTPLGNDNFEIFLPEGVLQPGMKVLVNVISGGKTLPRIPLYAKYVVQDSQTYAWTAEIVDDTPFCWEDAGFKPKKNLFIYECHIGMAQEEPKVGTYREFQERVLPRIKKLGYNTLQIMAVMEHPYYASFGYQVTNFFAASSRFGTPEELKSLINAAHKMGIAVLLDVVHSHASKNTREGLNEFDGTVYQFFHEGSQGDHAAWDTKCFNYGKNEVIHFLLSNLKFWLEEYHFDGFRFDGVTSMLYHDHGLGSAFTSYDCYFSPNTNTEAVTYLQLACTLAREVNPNAILIAEDMSAMPGLCLPVEQGGIGFDYRLAMGVPDMWIRLLKEQTDDSWNMDYLYYELTNRRPKEKVIGYCESHDQALVGDKTLMFRLCDAEMYWNMEKSKQSLIIDRGIALHKLLRLLTMSLGGNGYLTFMGNEFGHPEWIDFPREGNGWSYHYCRRQWSLADNENLKFSYLNAFEKAMVKLGKKYRLLAGKDTQLALHNERQTIVYKKGKAFFAFNFSPENAYDGFFLPTDKPGNFVVVMSTDDFCFGGQGRVHHKVYAAEKIDGRWGIRLYLPNRTAVIVEEE